MGTFMNAYRPEQHYMRGPGPKWRAKHTASLFSAAAAQPLVSGSAPRGNSVPLLSGILGWAASTMAAAMLGFVAVIVLA